jgi:hypothetical protein
MKIRDEKLKQKASIPKKLEDGWEPIVDMHVNDFDCHAFCDLGASISIQKQNGVHVGTYTPLLQLLIQNVLTNFSLVF